MPGISPARRVQWLGRRFRRWQAHAVAVALLAGLLAGGVGCASSPSLHSAPWPGGPEQGRTIVTEHYALHTTIEDSRFLADLSATMELAYEQYGRLAPLSRQPRRLHAYIYAYRDEWADYTEAITGSLAPVYLQIHRGGYAHGDIFATFYHGHPQTLAVCRHEGWHQYVANGFERRLPPFLEEGIATLFEAGFDGGNIHRPLPNGTRQLRLAEAVRRKRAWPLRELLGMHAGDVIGSDGPQIDTFYAQAWALARFLLEDERYRDGFIRMVAAYADGSIGGRGPVAALELHLKSPFEKIERDYQQYARRLAGADRADI
jgi:hypothetical protein